MTDALPLEVKKPKKAPPVKRTEAELFDLLRKRHTAHGNGGAGEYAVLAGVRNAAGFNATRTFDAVTVSLWPSRGFLLHAYEIKCTRSDWLRELKQPEKAEAAAHLVDRFSMVIADDSIIADGELPEPWGLLVAQGDKLRQVKEAKPLPGADSSRSVSRSFLICLLRAAGAVPPVEEAAIAAARNDGYHRGLESAKQNVELYKDSARVLQQRIKDFERESGVSLGGWAGASNLTAAELGALVRSVLAGEARAEQAQKRLVEVRQRLLDAAAGLDQFIGPTSL